ncbi:MAG TPA: hypothetical protein VM223_03955 [Planctomycetota bacterium]|nr:hypothetical protein [Planctomycetota bacterium]HUW30742.1 hypothetical protein [Planctomycetota bacterium]
MTASQNAMAAHRDLLATRISSSFFGRSRWAVNTQTLARLMPAMTRSQNCKVHRAHARIKTSRPSSFELENKHANR